MKAEKRTVTEIIRGIILLITVALSISFLIINIYTGMTGLEIPKSDSTDLTSDWKDIYGVSYRLDSLPEGDLVLKKNLKNYETNGKSICFISSDVNVTVNCGDETIYTYAPDIPQMLGNSYGIAVHTIPLPEGTESITMDLDPIFPDRPACISNARLENSQQYIQSVLAQGFPGFTICILMAALGVISLIIGIIGQNRLTLVNFGLFAILSAAFSANDTMIIQVLTGDGTIIRVISFLALILIPYPPVAFMSTVTDNRKNTLTTLVAAFVLINFTASSVLAATGISDYRYTVSLSRAGILVAVILAAYFVGSALYRRKINTKLLITVTISAGSAIVFVMLDLIRYSLFPPMIQSTELYTRIGVFIFLSVLMNTAG